MEDHDDVYLELDLELCVFLGGTRVDLGEQHVKWDLHVVYGISIGHLDVLNLCGLGLSLKCLNTNKLDLN